MKKTTSIEDQGKAFSYWPIKYDREYRPKDSDEYWFPEIEKADTEKLEALILFKLKNTLEWAWEKSPFYRKKWKEVGVTPNDLKTLRDFSKFPVIRKEDLRTAQEETSPFGSYLCIEPKEVARIHGTSGTTGVPTIFGIGRDDWARIANAHARILWAGGMRPTDAVFIGSFFSLYLGSWGMLAGAERLGAAVFPFGAGVSGQTVSAVRFITRMKPSCFYGTPSYALRLAEVAREEGFDPRKDFAFTKMFFSGEPGAGVLSTKKKIEEIFGAHCIDMGSMAEMTPWMTNGECRHRTGMHLWQDIVYTEVCDTNSFMPVPYGSEGTPVYTHLERTSQPMIRLLSGDLTRWENTRCLCGRNYPRLPQGIYGRIDDMLVVRGHNVYPSAIENIVRSIPKLSDEFRIIVSRPHELDEITVVVEHEVPDIAPAQLEAFRGVVAQKLQECLDVRCNVELEKKGTLSRTEFKARRVVKERDWKKIIV